MPQPELLEEAVHQRGMQHRDMLARHALDDLNDVAIEGRHLELLGGAALGGAPRELRRVDVIPDLDVASGSSLVPRADAAT